MTIDNLPEFGKSRINPDWKIAVIRSVWHPEVSSVLRDSAIESLVVAGIPKSNIIAIDAPGSFELPLLCKRALESGADGAIAIGIVVQGATHHAELIAREAASGCMQTQLALKKPIVFEVLFVNTLEDAKVRALGPRAKGPLAARTLLTQLAKLSEMRS
ncbi:6,7-dimethyl-8-ribityllumazine synthase [Candidatus Peribacteria bacterium]|nr:6,7-dimethyl-8-ribityllumazine synthase [Candidatus Peribacteria bacterium]